MTIVLPVQIAVAPNRAAGALIVEVGVQLSEDRLYCAPVRPCAPQMIIVLPVHTAV